MNKLFGTLAIAMLIFSSITPSFAAFSDVSSSHPNFEAIEFVQSQNIVGGYSDGSYRPDQTINRAEFVKILIEAIFESGLIDTCLNNTNFLFSDVDLAIWFAKYVCMARLFEIVAGYPDGSFGPGLEINFAEAAKIIANSFDLSIPPLQAGQQWYDPFIQALRNQNAIPDGLNDPGQKMTRGQMAEIIYRLRSFLDTTSVFTGPPSDSSNPSDSSAFSSFKNAVIGIVNQERAQEGLGPMSYSPFLEQSAQAHADDMRNQGYFQHDSLDGRSFDDRITASGYYTPFETCNCAGSASSGENIAKGQTTAAEVMDTWMNSPQHRANILNPTFDEIGIGITPVDPNEEGFTGFIWVQNFGNITLQ